MPAIFSEISSMILVTGAAGFIGSNVVHELVSSGRKVIAIDNFEPYYDEKLKQFRWNELTAGCQPDWLVCKKMNILDKPEMVRLFEEFSIEGVINLAAMAGVRNSVMNPMRYVEVNTMGTLTLMEVMRQFGARPLVLASTSSLYAGQPMPFDELMPVQNPISPYASSKLGAETMAYTYAHLHGMKVRVLRYFTVYGPCGRPDMAPFRMVEWIRRGDEIKVFGTGENTRDFTFVEDCAKATIRAYDDALLNSSGYELINIGGGGKCTSVNNLIELIANSMGKEARVAYLPAAEGDMLHTEASIEKALNVLKWTPTTEIGQGIERTIAWHLENSTWLDEVRME